MASPASRPLSVAVLADPGLPSHRLAAVHEALEEDLVRRFGAGSSLVTETQMIPLGEDYSIRLRSLVDASERQEPADVLVLLTEMPRHSGGHPMVAEVFREHRIAVISCPTLGVLRPQRRLREVVSDCVARAAGQEPHRSEDAGSSWNHWSAGGDAQQDRLLAHTFTGSPRTVLGMVASNDPWRTVPRLSSALAAAAGVGAFGIFYSSIWQMADDLSVIRLLCIAVMALVLMTAWLLFGNRLWDRPVRESVASIVALYNASTVVTLLLVISGLYLALFLFILVSGAVVIDPGFMSRTLGKTADAGNYVRVAWLSAAMGVVAGSLGSSFDSETDLRRLTHGQRERQRVLTADGSEDVREQDHVDEQG